MIKAELHFFVPLSFWKWSTSFSPWYCRVKSLPTADSNQIISEYAGDIPAAVHNRSSHTASEVFYRDMVEKLRRHVVSYQPILFPIHDLPLQYFSSLWVFLPSLLCLILWCVLGRALWLATPLRASLWTSAKNMKENYLKRCEIVCLQMGSTPKKFNKNPIYYTYFKCTFCSIRNQTSYASIARLARIISYK